MNRAEIVERFENQAKAQHDANVALGEAMLENPPASDVIKLYLDVKTAEGQKVGPEDRLEIARLARIGLEHEQRRPVGKDMAVRDDLVERIGRMFEVIDRRKDYLEQLRSAPFDEGETIKRLVDALIETQTVTWDILAGPRMELVMKAALIGLEREPPPEAEPTPTVKDRARIDADLERRIHEALELNKERNERLKHIPDPSVDSQTAIDAWRENHARRERRIWELLPGPQMSIVLHAALFGMNFEWPLAQEIGIAARRVTEERPIGPQEMIAIIEAIGEAVGRNVLPETIFGSIIDLTGMSGDFSKLSWTQAKTAFKVAHDLTTQPASPMIPVDPAIPRGVTFSVEAPEGTGEYRVRYEPVGGFPYGDGPDRIEPPRKATEGPFDIISPPVLPDPETIQFDTRQQVAMAAERLLREWITNRQNDFSKSTMMSLGEVAYNILLLAAPDSGRMRPWRLREIRPDDIPLPKDILLHFTGRTYRFLYEVLDPNTKDTTMATSYFVYEPEHPEEGARPFVRRSHELFHEVQNDHGVWVPRFKKIITP